MVGSQRHPRLPLSGRACVGRSDGPSPQDDTRKIGGADRAQEVDQWVTLVRFLWGILGVFWFEWMGGLVKVREIAEMFPRRSTAHRVVAKFKARLQSTHRATTSLPLPPRLCSSQLPNRYYLLTIFLQ